MISLSCHEITRIRLGRQRSLRRNRGLTTCWPMRRMTLTTTLQACFSASSKCRKRFRRKAEDLDDEKTDDVRDGVVATL